MKNPFDFLVTEINLRRANGQRKMLCGDQMITGIILGD